MNRMRIIIYTKSLTPSPRASLPSASVLFISTVLQNIRFTHDITPKLSPNNKNHLTKTQTKTKVE
jgi:hypothetical protein